MNMVKEYSFWSRKFIATMVGLILVSLGALATVWLPILVGLYPTYVGAVIGVLGLYMGGNIVNKYVVGKQQGNLLDPTVAIDLEPEEDKQD